MEWRSDGGTRRPHGVGSVVDDGGGRPPAGGGLTELYVAGCGLPADGLTAVLTAAGRAGSPLRVLGYDEPLRLPGVRDVTPGGRDR